MNVILVSNCSIFLTCYTDRLTLKLLQSNRVHAIVCICSDEWQHLLITRRHVNSNELIIITVQVNKLMFHFRLRIGINGDEHEMISALHTCQINTDITWYRSIQSLLNTQLKFLYATILKKNYYRLLILAFMQASIHLSTQ